MGEVQIERGVRQGSPLSALLFQLVLDNCMRDLWPSWIERGFGVDVIFRLVECDYDDEDDDYECEQCEKITNLCFADDTTLVTADQWTCRL